MSPIAATPMTRPAVTAVIAWSISVMPSPTRPDCTYGVAQQGHRVKLEVGVAEAPGNRQCGLGEPLSLGRVIAERRAVEREPPMLNALVQRIQRALGLREPPVRRSQIPVDATVQKGEAPSHLGRSLAIAGPPVEVEGFGLQLDRAVVLAQPLKGFAETGQRLRAAAHVQTALELHPGNHPLGGCQRLAPLPERVVGDLAHRPMIPDRRWVPPPIAERRPQPKPSSASAGSTAGWVLSSSSSRTRMSK